MKRFAALLTLLALLLSTFSARAEEADLDAQFGKIFRQYKTVGGVLVVAKDGEIVYERDYGYAQSRQRVPVTEKTYFRIASVTKMVSAIGVMRLVEAGKLDLDADLSDYFGYTIRNFSYPDKPITLRMLMSHTSSLSQDGGYTRNRALSEMLDYSLHRTSNFTSKEPGSTYKYSNFGAGLMGSLMELVTGENVAQVMDEQVFGPLGMDAACSAALVAQPDNVASIYDSTGTLKQSAASILEAGYDSTVDPDNHYRTTVGSVWIRGQDLCRIGMALCDGGMVDGLRILSEASVAEMLKSQQGSGGVTVDSPYGLCVNRVDSLVSGRMLYGHQGMSDGIVANVYFDPETRFVFAMVTNGSGGRQDHRIMNMSRKLFALAWRTFSGSSDEVLYGY